ncbi:CAAX prenyl protease [Plasmodiophora brassicae]
MSFTAIVLGAIVVHWLLDVCSTVLNIGALSTVLPARFRGVYEPERYARSQEYTRAKGRLSIVSSTYSTIVFLALWFSGSFNAVDAAVRRLGQSTIVTGILFIFSVLAILAVLELPVSVYMTFVIETRFGFNKTSVSTFVTDILKKVALALLLGSPLLAVLLSFLLYAGPSAWLYCWAALALFTLLMFFIGPKYLLPLFNKLTPLDDAELAGQIRRLADRVRFSFGSIYVMDGSKRSNHSNAFFAGLGSTKRIVLFDTLLKSQSSNEIVAILGHEMGHYKLGHIYMNLAFSMAHTFALFFLMNFIINSDDLPRTFLIEKRSVYVGLFFFTQVLAPIELVMQFAITACSRFCEYQADRFAVDTIDDPADLVTALMKLSVDNLSNLTPHWLTVAMSYTHPPILQRIEAVESRMANSTKRRQ